MACRDARLGPPRLRLAVLTCARPSWSAMTEAYVTVRQQENVALTARRCSATPVGHQRFWQIFKENS